MSKPSAKPAPDSAEPLKFTSSMRLGDFPNFISFAVLCRCGHSKHFDPGELQQKYRVQAEMTVEELPLRLRCSACQAHGPFRVTWMDDRKRSTLEYRSHILIVGWRG